MSERTSRKTRVGRVTSSAMDQTVIVSVETTRRHPLYSKTVRRQRKFYAHDADNSCGPGDMVRIVETRPLSKLKRWRVAEIVKKAQV